MATLDQEQKQQVNSIDLMECVSVMWWNKALIIVIAVLCGLSSYIVADMQFTPKYSSTTQIYIFEKQTGTSTSAADLSLGMQIAPDCIELIRSRKVIEDAIERLGNGYYYGYINGCISVENTADTRILAITATASDPREAQKIANAVRISASEHIADIMDLQAVNLIQEANFPTGSSSFANLRKSTLTGFLAGLLAACLFVIIRNQMDDTIKTPEDVTRYLDLSILGTLPYHEKDEKTKRHGRRSKYKDGDFGTDGGTEGGTK